MTMSSVHTEDKTYRIPKIKMMVVRDGNVISDSPIFFNSQQVNRFLAAYYEGHDREEMLALILNAKFRILGLHTIAIGSLETAIVHPRETFKAAITMNASAIVLAHTHPSGDPTPSQEDRTLTKRLVEAGALLGIAVIDHIVIGETSYYSFADTGTLK